MAGAIVTENPNKGNYLLRDVAGKEAFNSPEKQQEKEHRVERQTGHMRSETVPDGPGDKKPNLAWAEMSKPEPGKHPHAEIMMKGFEVQDKDKVHKSNETMEINGVK